MPRRAAGNRGVGLSCALDDANILEASAAAIALVLPILYEVAL
jgi:hypothetical protein